MKRNLVMDVLTAHQTEPIGEWQEEKYSPHGDKIKVRVKLTNGDECFAYYYADKGILFNRCTLYPINQHTNFWHAKEHFPIQNVTHWKYLKE